MNIQPVFTRYDINRKIPFDRSSPIVVDHVEDYETRFIEVYVYESIYNKQVDLKGTTIIARIVAALSTEKILLNDNVACTINGSGNIIIPIDGKVIETLASTLLIEVRITQDDQALVLPFPLYVQMRGSILDDAGIAPESRGTIPELLEAATAALEEAKNYENLENKPQINGHTLSGNKTSDDLGLQKKLTAGQNITIANDGTISAEDGGVTSYNDLTDKPQIYVPVYNSSNELVGNENITIEDIINMTYGFCVRINSQGNKSLEPYNIYNYSLYSDKDYLVGRKLSYYGKYDFDELSYDLRRAGMWETLASQCKHVPAFISDLFVSGSRNYIFFITHYHSHVGVAGGAPMIRSVAGKDKNGNFRIYYQYIKLSDNNDGTISNQSDWVELTGGSQIVSGVVNQNGTITFTDSDGNTFTTTGASVIGPQGNPGQDYVLTEQDKADIADIVLGELPTTEGVLYGN